MQMSKNKSFQLKNEIDDSVSFTHVLRLRKFPDDKTLKTKILELQKSYRLV